MLGLHDAAIKSGALWQVLWFIRLLEIPFLLNFANGSIDGTGDISFDPLGLSTTTSSPARAPCSSSPRFLSSGAALLPPWRLVSVSNLITSSCSGNCSAH